MSVDWSLQTRIVQHHVGGRGFSLPNHIPGTFALDFRHVLYEADAGCAAAMQAEVGQSHLRDCRVLPYALGRARGQATLYVTANPYASSTLPPNPAFFGYYAEVRYNVHFGKGTAAESMEEDVYDVVYGDELKVEREVALELHALDDLMRDGTVPGELAPDIVSIDTQGTEIDVLEGAVATIDAHALAIVSEIDFLPMYSGQGSLADVLTYGDRHGFVFAGFTETHDISPHRLPIGQRGQGFTAFGDVLLLRRLDSLRPACASDLEFHLKASKLAFVAMSFGRVDYGMQCLQAADAVLPPEGSRDAAWTALSAQLGRRNWYAFLRELVSAAGQMPELFPATERREFRDRAADGPTTGLVHLQKPDRWLGRARAVLSWIDEAIEGDRRRVRELVFRQPHVAALKSVYYLVFAWAERRQNLAISRFGRHAALLAEGLTPFEAVFERYGWSILAQELRQRRLSVLQFVTKPARSL